MAAHFNLTACKNKYVKLQFLILAVHIVTYEVYSL